MDGSGPPVTETATVASRYAAAGIPVFPCAPATKRPLTPHGFKDATTDAAQVEAWWRGRPDAMIGIPTGEVSGLCVIDLDVDKDTGETVGAATIAALNLADALTAGLWASTPSGGEHVYFRPPACGLASSAAKIGPGVDIRGDGGYVIAPGSVRADGRAYRWKGSGQLESDRSGLPVVPEAILAALNERKPCGRGFEIDPGRDPWAQAALDQEVARVAAASEGARNATLFRAGAALANIAATERLDWPDCFSRLTVAATATGLPPGEIARTLANAWTTGRQTPRSPAPAATMDKPPDTVVTEHALAAVFTERHGADWLFDHDRRSWVSWQGDHWAVDRTAAARDRMRQIAGEMAAERPARERSRIERASVIDGALKLAASDRAHAVDQGIWDNDPMLLGCPGTTIDLRTGAQRPPRKADRMTLRTAIAPADTADCPRWHAFLEEATGGDADLIRFLQQIAGYSATGETREHALFFLYGPGENGKSVFLNTIAGVLGDYARTAAMETFTAARYDRHSTELAMLKGGRLVTASETEEGRAWAESRIKALTGGDPITARFMRQDNFTFVPNFKLVIAGNHKPVLANVDAAMRRRINIVPFLRSPAHPDKALEETLKREWPGILRWILDGTRDWLANGLARPALVAAETEDYFAVQDSFGQWLEDSCRVEPGNAALVTTSETLFRSWKAFALERDEEPGTQKRLTDRLAGRGLRSVRMRMNGRQVRGWQGIALHRGSHTP